jgi:Lon protease-like protein
MTTHSKPRPLPPAGEVRSYPVLPLRDIVVFPHMIVPLFVGREKSIRALEEAMRSDIYILLATQKNASDDDPATNSIYEVGTLASVLQLVTLPDGTVTVQVEGVARARVQKYDDLMDYYEAEAVVLADELGEKVEAMARSVVNEFENYVKLNTKISPEVVGLIHQIEDYAQLADNVASHLAIKIPAKQQILETTSVPARLKRILGLMESEISVLLEKRIHTRVNRQDAGAPVNIGPETTALPDGLSAPVAETSIPLTSIGGNMDPETVAAWTANLTALPAGLTCGRIDASNWTNLATIGPGLVANELNISGTAIEELPALRVTLRLEANQCQRLKRLPAGLKVGVLSLRECPALEALPDGLDVSFLDLSGCVSLRALPDDLRVEGGRLRVRDCPRLRALPAHLGRLAQLDIAGCLNITELPESLTVSSWIDIGGAGLTGLPSHLEGVGLRWRGVPIDARIAFRPETLSHEEVLAERNAERRRVMLERYGLDRFMSDAEAETLDEDRDAGGRRRLLRLKLEGDEDLVCITVVCPSTERQFVLRVPPTMRTCRQAIAWTAGFDDPDMYNPMAET